MDATKTFSGISKDAGFIEYAELPGTIKTGCQASPDYMSRYCANH